MSTLATRHIVVDDTGVAYIEGTTLKVIEVALEKLSYGWSPEEIHYQHYGKISLAQIHDALAYYYDHQKEMDKEIERIDRDSDAMLAHNQNSPIRKRLRGMGKLP